MVSHKPYDINAYVDWLFENPGKPWPGDEMVEHRFWLRPKLQVRVWLPADLTLHEADRLRRFIATLPLANPSPVDLGGKARPFDFDTVWTSAYGVKR